MNLQIAGPNMAHLRFLKVTKRQHHAAGRSQSPSTSVERGASSLTTSVAGAISVMGKLSFFSVYVHNLTLFDKPAKIKEPRISQLSSGQHLSGPKCPDLTCTRLPCPQSKHDQVQATGRLPRPSWQPNRGVRSHPPREHDAMGGQRRHR